MLLVLGSLAVAAPAGAGAHGVMGGAFSASPVAGYGQAGVATPPATATAVSGTLQQATGDTPGQVQLQDVCGAAPAGGASCAAQTLVLRSSGASVRPRAHHFATPRVDAGASHATIAAPATAPATSPPTAGTPAYLQQAYDLTALAQSAGSGDTVGIVDAYNDPSAASDLATYRSNFGLPACTASTGCFKQVNENGNSTPLPSNDSGWAEEESLDLDAVSALCPNCKIVLVEASSANWSDLTTAVATADAMGAEQISNSYSGSSSTAFGASSYSFPGVAVLAATGDSGYAGAGYDNYPAALAGVTAAGGTTLTAASGGQGARGFGESAWSLSGGEGGGSGCDLQEAKPSYQSDTGCTGRSYADVSADANPYTGMAVYDSAAGGWLQAGGTSLATPLVAAFYALTGVTTSTAQWAYAESSLLNDPTTGSSGSCASNIAYICNAGVGYDGPTGAGSISGDVAVGAPGIGGPADGTGANNTYAASVNSTGASITGGVYPNGIDTSWWVEYGTSNAYGQHTAPVDIGSGAVAVSVSAALVGLTPSSSYHYRLVAQNSSGTTYGYDYSLSTSAPGASPPASTALPVITGSADQGHTLSVSTGSWSPAATAYTYRWQRSVDGGGSWSNISGATGATYTLGLGDGNALIQAIVTASNSNGQASATAADVGPVTSEAPVDATAPAVNGTTTQGQTLSNDSGTWSPAASSYTYQWQRSVDGVTWSSIVGATGATYLLASADIGAQVRVLVTASNQYGTSATATASSAVGPVISGAPVNTALPTITGSVGQGLTLTASSGTWSPAGSSYAYAWQRSTDGGGTWANIAGATATTYTLTPADAGDDIRVVVTATNPYGVASATSATVGPVTTNPPVNSAAPPLTGTPQRSDTLTAGPGTWSGTGNAYTYQWQRSADGSTWANISGATLATYVVAVADEADVLRVVVTATNTQGAASLASSATSTIAPYPPSNTVVPTVSGVVQRDTTLTSTPGTWTGAGSNYTYQWQEDDGEGYTDISGATGLQYELAASDEGYTVRLVVTATNPDGVVMAASTPTATVPSSPPVNTTLPAITGTAARGSTLTVGQGAWDGIGNTYGYQWQSSPDGTTWTNIAGATAATYALSIADEGNQLRVAVTATNEDATVTADTTATTAVPAAPPVNTVAPVISGTAQRTVTLTASQGTWNGVGNAYSYQWQSSPNGTSWTNLAGATSTTYTLGLSDEGNEIRVQVTAANPDATVPATSAATAAVTGAPPTNAAVPTIAGTAQRGTTLTSAQGTWNGLGDSFAYQWQRSADSGTTWTAISGASSSSYTLVGADESDLVRLLVTATNADGSLAVPSAATTAVAASPPVLTTAPVVSGSAVRASTLTAASGVWSGAANTYALQWQRSADGSVWVSIAGATAPTYVLGVADEGDVVRVLVTATNVDGSVPAASAPTATIAAAPPVVLTAPSEGGTVQRTGVLTASAGTWSGVGNAYSYQWQRSADGGQTWTAISGATAITYTLAAADEGDVVRVLVTATNPDAAVGAASAATTTVPASPPTNTALPVITGAAQRGTVLTVTPGAWGGLGNVYTVQWQHSSGGSYTNITGATASTYTLGVADEGTTLRVVMSATNADGTASVTTPATAAVAAQPPVDTALPAITGTAQRTMTLSATPGTWSGVGNAYTYQWQRSPNGTTWTSITGATASSYTVVAADENNTLHVLVTATNPDATVSAASAATATVAVAPPVNTAAPAVTGTAQRSMTLSATQGTWTGLGTTYTYQWQHSLNAGSTWTAISGANATTYTVAVSDEASILRVAVTGTNADGSATADSAATATVIAQPPVDTVLPTVTGAATRSTTLVATLGTWSGVGNSYTYQWQHSTDGGQTWATITGAITANYTLGLGDEGTKLRMLVTATNPDGSVSTPSAPTSTVLASPPVNLSAPTLTGTAQRTATLTAALGTWTGTSNAYAYQWQRSGDGGNTWTPISGATASTYAPVQSDEGMNVRVLVTASNPDGSAGVPTAATTPVRSAPPVNTTAPTVTGIPRLGSLLTVDVGAWTPTTPTFSYQWQSATSANGPWTGLAGATSSTYTVAASDSGNLIRVIVTATNVDASTAATSAPSASVAQAPVNTVAPVAPSGTLMDSYTLTADPGTWNGSGNTFTYVWERCASTATSVTSNCAPVGTGSSYTLVAADVGFTIAANVTATSYGGSTTIGGALSAAVTGRPLTNTSPPYISGTPQVNQTLSGNPGSWSVPLSNVTYTWSRCDADGTSNCAVVASGPTYVPGTSDVNDTIVVTANAVSPGRTTSASSPALTIQSLPVPQNTSLPTITGVAQRTATLKAAPGTWTSNPTLTYQWQRCNGSGAACANISGATGTTYLLTHTDEGSTISVRVTGTNVNGAGAASAHTTAVVVGIPPVDTHLPVVQSSGANIQQGTPLSIAATTWNANSETTYSEVLERCNANGANCAAIAGTSTGKYTPVAADVGNTLVAVVTATNPDGAVSATSAASAVVLPAAPRWKTLPVMSSDPGRVGDVITISPGTFTGPAVSSDLVTMQRCTNACVPVGTANASSYTIAAGDVGSILRVQETATDAGGSTVLWTTSYVGPVTSAAAGFALVGARQPSSVLSADGTPLAVAQIGSSSPDSVAASAGGLEQAQLAVFSGRVVHVKRARGIKGWLRAWVCETSVPAGGPPPPCTISRRLRRNMTVRLPAGMTGKVLVIVVRGKKHPAAGGTVAAPAGS